MTTETTVQNVKINKLTKAQYDSITPSNTEAYEITDLSSILDGKQDTINANNKLDYSYLSNTPTIPTVNNATLTITQGGVSKGTFTANASSDVTIALDAGGGSSVDIDNKSITENSNDELQTVGVIDQNNTSNAIKTWTGTKAQYDAIVTKDVNTLYNITDDADVTFQLLELIYPVGSIYIGTMSVCPLQTLGLGTWQLVAGDRVLQGAGTKGAVKTELPQNVKLPNITGGFFNQGRSDTGAADGAFYKQVTSGQYVANPGSGSNMTVKFDASRSSSVYSGDGTDTEIQQSAYLVNIWERIS